jgi:hypothetical protein
MTLCFRTNAPEKISDELMWFIGFAEGDGCLYTDGIRLWFVATQAEASVLYRVRNILGFGSVRADFRPRPMQANLSFVDPDSPKRTFQANSDRYYYRLTISNREGIKKLIDLFNGRFVCQHRREQLSKWILVWNHLYPKEYITELQSDAKPTLLNAWLSGFLDAEGGFSISIAPRNSTSSMKPEAKKFRVRPRVFCDQKNEEEVLVAIARAFKAGRVSFRAGDKTQFRWMIDTWKHVEKVKAYLSRYPLRTRKHLVFLRWLKVRQLVLRKEHLTDEGLQKIRKLCTHLQKGRPVKDAIPILNPPKDSLTKAQ